MTGLLMVMARRLLSMLYSASKEKQKSGSHNYLTMLGLGHAQNIS